MKNKAQITIFIIIAVIIVAGIAIFFIIISKTKPEMQRPSMDNPQAYIEKCARDAASEAIDIMLPQGGYLNPVNYKLYNDTKVAYLCYIKANYQPCIMQTPLFIEHFENEITNYITGKIDLCFNQLKTELEAKSHNVKMEGMNVSTILGTGNVQIKINRIFNTEKNQETRRFDSFKTAFNSPLYNLGIVAMDIANEEAKYCNFEYLGYMIMHKDFSIDKKPVGSGENSSKIYIINDRYTNKKLNIAIRSCAIPAGF
ncbi:hypothetical protein FJZ19_00335 [Candidatus Pacearchaeota archaeon]|nr:hypothetical protein [Candidatus Pacearchaeota archaeon]